MTPRLRIAVYHALHSGGAKRTLYEQSKRLASRHRLDLYSLDSADNDFCDIRPYVTESHIYPFEPLPLFQSPLGRLNHLVRLVDLIRLQNAEKYIAAEIARKDYDVAFVHPSRYTQSPPILRFLAPYSVYYCHEPLRKLYEASIDRPYDERALGRRILDTVDLPNRLYEIALKRCDAASLTSAHQVLVNSHFSQENVRRIYGVTAKVCYHGVDVEVFHPQELGKKGMILSVGALTPAKGFDFVIESLEHIPTDQRPKLSIVSNYQEPTEYAYLSQLAAAKGVEVSFHTMIDEGKLVEMYNRAVATVYAAVREPFGLIPLEAMACGTPVVAVGEGGVCESVVHRQTGLLTERDSRQFAAAIRTLLGNAELAREYGAQARRYVLEKWSWDKSIQQVERCLLQAANCSAQEANDE